MRNAIVCKMKWYGSNSRNKFLSINYKQRQHRLNQQKRLTRVSTLRHANYQPLDYFMIAPAMLSTSLARITTHGGIVAVYHSRHYFLLAPLPIFFTNPAFNAGIGTVSAHTSHYLNFFKLYKLHQSLVQALFETFILRRIKFRGKGYYIYRNKRNTVAFKFGFAHRVYCFGFRFTLKTMSKTCILLFGHD